MSSRENAIVLPTGIPRSVVVATPLQAKAILKPRSIIKSRHSPRKLWHCRPAVPAGRSVLVKKACSEQPMSGEPVPISSMPESKSGDESLREASAKENPVVVDDGATQKQRMLAGRLYWAVKDPELGREWEACQKLLRAFNAMSGKPCQLAAKLLKSSTKCAGPLQLALPLTVSEKANLHWLHSSSHRG